jgi:hypothetical protein
MSRAYWVKLGKTISEEISAGDEVSSKIELQPLCGADEMKDILRKNLEEDGWAETDQEGVYKKEIEGIDHTWDVNESRVKASLEHSEDVTEEVTVTSRGYSIDAARSQAKKDLKDAADKGKQKIKDKEKDLQKKISQQLAETESKRNEAIRKVLEGTYGDALKRKARRMGTVTDTQENRTPEGGYSLEITVAHD